MTTLKSPPIMLNFRYNEEFDFDIDFDKLPQHSLKVGKKLLNQNKKVFLSSRSWTGKEFSPSLRSLEPRRSPWTTQDFVEGSPTGSFWRPTRRTPNRLFGPEVPLADLGPHPVSVPSARCARPPSSSGDTREEPKFCTFSSDATFHSCC